MANELFDHQAALAACAQGDAQALEQLYEREAPHMLALASSMLPDTSTAQNALHDTFVLIWKNASSYDARTGSARAWIYSIMRYRSLALLRQTKSAPRQQSVRVYNPTASTSPDNSLISALALQPENAQKAILMAFYHGMNYSEVARHLHNPVDDLRHQVRLSLQSMLESIAS